MFALTHWFSLVLGGMALMWALGHLVKRWSYVRLTVLNDLPALGHPHVGGKVGQTAVVCGGSVAGLLSARVLSDHFEEVVIVDPDADVLLKRALAVDALRFPDGKDADGPARPRVMQWTAYHLAQTIFFTALDKLFPSLRAELAAGDVPVGTGEYNIFLGGVHLPLNVAATPAGMRTTIGISRAANETLVRRLVAQTCPNVRFLAGTVIGVVPNAGGKSLEAVQYRPTADARQVEVIKTALVVDCSGSTNAGLGWLQRAGYPLAKDDLDESYHPHMRYSTCVFQTDPDVVAKIKPPHIGTDTVSLGFFFPVQWLDSRHFAIEHLEGGKLVIAGGGAGFEGKITSVDELRAHIESINQLAPTEPWVRELLDYVAGQPAQTATYSDNRVSALRRIKYAQHAQTLPSNFVAVGDSRMRLNPVNGQGLGKAAVEAIALDACLRRVHAGSTHQGLPADLGAKYFARVSAITDGVWTGTRTNDYGEDSCTPTKGESLELGSFSRRINKVVVRRMIRGDADLWLRVMSVRGWLMPSTGLMVPSVVLKVVWDLLCDVWEGGKTGDLARAQ